MPISPRHDKTDQISHSILTDGKEISAAIEVISIHIKQKINSADHAEIVIVDGHKAKKTFAVSSSNTFTPGSHIEIKLGYHNENESIFKGLIAKQVIVIEDHMGSYLKVICEGKDLNINDPSRSGGSFDITSPPILEVQNGATIDDLEIELDAKHESSVLKKYRGTILFQGSAQAKINSMIQVKGLGDRFDGDFYISGVDHDVRAGQWFTEVHIGISLELIAK